MTDPALLRQRFLAEPRTLRNERRDFHAWHRGRPHYLLWALDVDAPPLRARVTAAQRALDGLLLEDYRRQPHITLALCGFPAVARAPAADEFDAGLIVRQLAALQAAAPAAFELAVGGLESFSSAPFLCVHDPSGALASLRRCLQVGDDDAHGGYVPHVTVGLYAGAWPTAELAERFRALADAPRLACRIDRLSLMGYDAADIGGSLFTLADYDLAARRLRWRDVLSGTAADALRRAVEGVLEQMTGGIGVSADPIGQRAHAPPAPTATTAGAEAP